MPGLAAMRVSKITIGSLLLALLLGVGLLRWSLGHRDDCSQYLAGDQRAPSSQLVVTGSREVIIPCSVWLPRQPTPVQFLCLVEFVLVVLFVLRAAGDLRAHLASRRPPLEEDREGN